MLDRDKLISILNLLDSTNAGECANAGKAAARMVHDAGKTWGDLIAPASYDELLSLAFELQERGWPTRAAAGIAMNLRPPANGECPNLANWPKGNGRWSQMLDYCSRSNNADHTSIKSQLDFLNYNLNGPYQLLSAKIRAAKTVAEASRLFKTYMGNDDARLS